MKRVLLFGGTSETPNILSQLALYKHDVTLCVASEYGRALATARDPSVTVLVGRLDATEIESLLHSQGDFLLVIDATHPYAVEATANIRAAAERAGVPYLRYQRERCDISGVTVVSSATEAAERLSSATGNILLTTGTKDLEAYTAIPDFAQRVYPRVLPTVESISACVSNGFVQKRIVAMQGPFSKQLNAALIREYNIRTLVTKESGKAGGFQEKLDAAHELNVSVVVIGRPKDDGLGWDALLAELSAILEDEK